MIMDLGIASVILVPPESGALKSGCPIGRGREGIRRK